MNKKTLSVLLILCMLLTMVPVTALAEDVVNAEPVAANDTEQLALQTDCVATVTTPGGIAFYDTLQAAVTAAKVGDKVTLVKDVTLTEQVTINKAITLNGGNNTITGKMQKTAAILVTADNATVQNVTVSGPNTNTANSDFTTGWDGGEYGIKVYNATGVTLSNVAVTAANAGILVSSSDVAMTGTITVSGNEFGGIEVSKGSNLAKAGNLTIADSAEIVCTDEKVPAIWIDGTTASEGVVTGGNYPSINVGTQIYYATSQELLNKIAANNGIVAIANEKGYKTLQEAVTGAETNATVTMLADAKEDVTIPKDKDITLDLNGKTLTNVSGDTITIANGASLTITGEGTVDNITHQKAAIYNNGTTVLDGGYYYRSKETGVDADTSGGNSYYTILNHGAMTINAGVTIEQCGKFSSMIDNGYSSYNSGIERSGFVSNTNMAEPTLTINGGNFNGGLNTVKNDDKATLTIENGTFVNATQAVVQNHHKATIKNGTFSVAESASYVIDNCPCNSTLDIGEITIEGGTFSGGVILHRPAGNYGFVKLSGGTYSSKPAAEYVEKGKGVVQNEDGTYTVKTIESTDVTTAVDMAEPKVEVSNEIPTETQQAVTNVANSIAEPTPEDKTSVLAETAANVVTTEDQAAALAGLKKAQIDTNGEEVKVVVVPYFQIEAKECTTVDGTITSIKLDIKPVCDLKATTAAETKDMVEENTGDIVKNTVVLETARPMTVKEDITLCVVLPTNFNPQVVKHEHEGSVNYYPVQISEKAGDEGTTKVATFTVKDGFSDFTFMADDRKATINFDKEIANGDKKAIYGIDALGTKLPTVSGNFIGWKINGTTYTTLTEELWNAIAGKEVDAVAQFSSSGSSSGGSSSGGGAAIVNKVTVTTPDSDVTVKQSAVSSSVINDVKDAVADDKNVQVVGGSSNTVNITAKQDGNTLTSFDNPLTVTVPVSSNVLANVKDTSKLTLAQVTKDANGEIVLTYVGGNYNADKKTFTAYVDEPGNYVLLVDADVQKIELQIGDKASTVNGRTVMNDVAPIIVNDRTMIPLRFVSEALGAQVDWNEAARTVTIKQDGVTMRMTIDKMIDGFNAAPIIRNSRTMVPVRYIAEKLGANVIYVPITQEIIVVK